MLFKTEHTICWSTTVLLLYIRLPTSNNTLACTWAVIFLSKNAPSHLSFPMPEALSVVTKRRRQREFSGVQEGKRNYGFLANVHGPSWFWSGSALSAPSSVVSSHASQTRCLTEKRALAGTSRGLEASGRWWVSHMQGGGGGWHHPPPSASGSSRSHSLIPFGFSPSSWT